MGLYPQGVVPDFNHPAIQAEMIVPLQGMFTAHIQVIDRGMDMPGTYDPVADTTIGKSAETIIFDSGPNGAFCQSIRLPTLVSFGDQAVSTQGLQFQCLLDPSLITQSGLIIKVLDGGNDPTLVNWEYVLLDPIDSSVAWGRVYEARALVS